MTERTKFSLALLLEATLLILLEMFIVYGTNFR
jgi:hypothetical protein